MKCDIRRLMDRTGGLTEPCTTVDGGEDSLIL